MFDKKQKENALFFFFFFLIAVESILIFLQLTVNTIVCRHYYNVHLLLVNCDCEFEVYRGQKVTAIFFFCRVTYEIVQILVHPCIFYNSILWVGGGFFLYFCILIEETDSCYNRFGEGSSLPRPLILQPWPFCTINIRIIPRNINVNYDAIFRFF